ncbi:MAG: hypothetical protein ABSD59_07475 [Terracidiphilus sp.]|jgi:hypothetical protein
MNRPMIQAVLLFSLCPLLMAKRNTTLRVPKDTKIELVALESISSESAIAGTPVRFAVAKDVVVDGATVLRAGTPVTGTVTEVVRGIAGKREGLLRIRVREVSLVGGHPLRLTSSDPQIRQTSGDRFKDGAVKTFEVFESVAFLPIELAMAVTMPTEGNGKPSGEDAVLPRCFQGHYWVTTPSTLDIAGLAKIADQEIALAQDNCVSGLETSHIDWSVSDSDHLTLK